MPGLARSLSPSLAALLFLFLFLPAAHAKPAPAAAAVPVHGQVVGPDGRGVPGAAVELQPVLAQYDRTVRNLEGQDYVPPLARAVSGADGSFVVWASAEGLARVLVRAPGCVPMQGPLLMLPGEAALPVVRLERDAGLRVRVLDSHGRPAAGARVMGVPVQRYRQGPGQAEEWGWTPADRLGVTGADGSVTLARAPGEALRARVIAPLHAPQWGCKAARRSCLVKLAPSQLATVKVQGGAGPLPDLVVRDPESGLALDQGHAGTGRLLVAVPQRGRAAFDILTRDGRWAPLVFGGAEESRAKGGLPTTLALRSLDLPDAGVVVGRVADAKTRRPVPGAYVWRHGDAGAYVRADAQGRFRLEGAAAYQWAWLAAAAPGHSPGRRLFPVLPEAGADLPAILLEPRHSLAGVVVDGQGHPLAGAEVQTSVNETRQGSDWSQPVATDSAGRFLIPNLTAGVVDVRVTHPGFAPAIRTATAGEPSLRVVLRPGHTAFGSVEDEDEKPLAGVAVELKRTGDPTVSAITDRWIYRTTTGRDGRFELANLPAGSFTLLLDSPDFGREWSQVTISEEEERVDLGSFWPAHPRVTGRVVDPQGKPIARARIWSQASRWNVIRERKAALTNEAGAFSFPAPDEGSVQLEVQREGFGMVQREVDPKAGPIEVVLHPAAKVSGRVLSPEGKGIAGARIKSTPLYLRLTQPWYTTDSDGHFELPEQAPGEIELEVTASGYLPGEKVRIAVQAGQSVEDVEIVLSPGVALAGRVLAEDGEPLFGASVVSWGEPSQLTKTDPEGRYVLSGLKPGEQDLQVRHQGFKDAHQKLEIQTGENRLDWTLVGYKRHPVRGRVLAVDGSPAAGALVIFNDGEDRAPLRVLSGLDGAFEILLEELHYAYTVHAEKGGSRSGDIPVQVKAAAVEGLELQLAAPASLSGRILGLPEGVQSVSIEVSNEGLRITRQGSGKEHYHVAGLFSGQWEVKARAGWLTQSVAVAVPPKGGNTELDLDFSDVPRIFVQVLDSDGRPLGCKVFFFLSGETQFPAMGESGPDGAFTISLREGQYSIATSCPGHDLPTEQRSVTLTGQESVVELRLEPRGDP